VQIEVTKCLLSFGAEYIL